MKTVAVAVACLLLTSTLVQGQFFFPARGPAFFPGRPGFFPPPFYPGFGRPPPAFGPRFGQGRGLAYVGSLGLLGLGGPAALVGGAGLLGLLGSERF